MAPSVRRAWAAFLTALVAEDSTTTLEWFFAYTTIFCGLYILSPAWDAFPLPTTLLYSIPEWITGSVFLIQGLAHYYVMYSHQLVGARRAILGNAALWSAVTVSYLISPPHTVLLVAVASCIATASFLVYLRLDLLFRGPT